MAFPDPTAALTAPVVVDAWAVVLVDGSSTMVGPGRAAVVVVDFPMIRPRCELPLEAQAAPASIVAATPAAAVLRRRRVVLMRDWKPFPEPSEMLGMAYT